MQGAERALPGTNKRYLSRIRALSKPSGYRTLLRLYECAPKRAFVAVSKKYGSCLLYTSPSPRDRTRSRMPSSA